MHLQSLVFTVWLATKATVGRWMSMLISAALCRERCFSVIHG